MKFGLLFLSAGAVLFAQTFLQGTIYDSVTGAPVAGAYIVSPQRTAGDPMPMSDASGHFRVEVRANQISSNQVYVSVGRNGYLVHWQNVAVKIGSDVRVPLTPQAVISGHVMDENGLPVRGAIVSLLKHEYVNGKIQMRQWRGGTATNELGEYRIFDLPAGRYYLAAAPEKLADWDPRYGQRYYPGAGDAEHAEAIEVQAGEERGGRDLRLVREDGVTISGSLAWPDGGKRTLVNLFLQSTEHSNYSIPVKLPGGDAFLIAHVPPGIYTLRTWRDSMLQARIGEQIADMTLQVDKADLRNVSLEVRTIEEQEVSGTIVFQGRTKPGPMEVSMRSDRGGALSVISNADGSFVAKEVLPGRYILDVRPAKVEGVAPTDGSVIAEKLAGQDVLVQGFYIGAVPPGPLKISVAAPVAKIPGKLVDAVGRPVAGALIGLLSREGNILSGTRTEVDGTFTATVRVSGEHQVIVVVGDNQSDSFRDPDFLEAHKSDFPAVLVAEGANPPLLLRLPAN